MGPSPSVLDTLQGAAEWLRLVLALFGAIAILVGAGALMRERAEDQASGEVMSR